MQSVVIRTKIDLTFFTKVTLESIMHMPFISSKFKYVNRIADNVAF